MNKKDLTFEETIDELEKIVVDLEKGDLTLDQSVEKFELGMKLSKTCNDILQNAEKRISILVEEDNQLVEQDFINEN